MRNIFLSLFLFVGQAAAINTTTDINATAVTNANIDGSSITKRGNTFNGVSQLVLTDSSTGYVQNADIDPSSVTKLGTTIDLNSTTEVTGTLINANLDTTSVTKQGNTFNAANQLLLLDGSAFVPNINVDPSSVTKLGPQINLDSAVEITGTLLNANLDPSSVTKLGAQINLDSSVEITGTLLNANLDVASVTKQGNSFNGANQLLQLDSGGLVNNVDLDPSSVTKLGGSIEGSEITDETIQSADIQNDTILGSDIATTASLAIASITVGNVLGSQVTTSTGALVNSTRACNTGYTRVGASECYDTDGGRAIDISSVPTGGTVAFLTQDLTVLNGSKAVLALLRVKCQTSQNASEGINATTLYLQKPGAGLALNDGTKVCTASNRIASAGGTTYMFDFAEVWAPVDGSRDIAYACVTDAFDNDVSCNISVMGYKEQE